MIRDRVNSSRRDPTPGSGCTAEWHGTVSAASNYRCRCPDAVEAKRRANSRTHNGYGDPAHVDATGAARKIAGMGAIGYSLEWLAGRLDCSKAYMASLLQARRTTIHEITDDRVDGLYRELCHVPARWNPDVYPDMDPNARQARIERIERLAAARGQVSPFRWDGDSINDPTARPDGPGPQTTRGTSKRQAERYLAGRGAEPDQHEEEHENTQEEAAMTRAGDDGGHVACEPCGEIVDVAPGEAMECPHNGDDDHAQQWAEEADVDDGPAYGDDDPDEDADGDADCAA